MQGQCEEMMGSDEDVDKILPKCERMCDIYGVPEMCRRTITEYFRKTSKPHKPKRLDQAMFE